MESKTSGARGRDCSVWPGNEEIGEMTGGDSRTELGPEAGSSGWTGDGQGKRGSLECVGRDRIRHRGNRRGAGVWRA